MLGRFFRWLFSFLPWNNGYCRNCGKPWVLVIPFDPVGSYTYRCGCSVWYSGIYFRPVEDNVAIEAKCELCRGVGVLESGGTIICECPECEGTGMVLIEVPKAPTCGDDCRVLEV